MSFAPGTYKIMSAVDGNCIDAEAGGGKKEGKLISYHYEGSANQHFSVNPEGSGYRLANLVPAKKNDAMLTIDVSEKKGVVLLDFNGSESQQWQLAPIEDGVYMIRNVESGRCLRTMGHGNQVKVFDEAPEDRSQHWNLVPV